MLNISQRIKSPSFVPLSQVSQNDETDSMKSLENFTSHIKSESLDEMEGLDEVEQEIQSIIFNSPIMPRPSSSPRGGRLSPPLGGSKIVSPRFSPRIKHLNVPVFREENEEIGLRSSTTELFRAFSHSPTPVDNVISEDESMGDVSSEEERSITPPLRTSNPIIFNSRFINYEESKSVKSVDIGLLSVSPSLEDMQIRSYSKINSGVFDPFVNSTSKDLNTLTEVEETLFDLL